MEATNFTERGSRVLRLCNLAECQLLQKVQAKSSLLPSSLAQHLLKFQGVLHLVFLAFMSHGRQKGENFKSCCLTYFPVCWVIK